MDQNCLCKFSRVHHQVYFIKRAGLLALLFVMFSCDFVTFPCGVLGQVWYLIVSISDLYLLLTWLNKDILYLINETDELCIGLAPITQVTNVRNKIVTFRGGHLM